MSVQIKKTGDNHYSVNGKSIKVNGRIDANEQLNVFEYVCLKDFIDAEDKGLRLASTIKTMENVN